LRTTRTLILIAVAIVTLDLATKALAEARLEPSSPVRVVGEVVRLTLVHNSGTAFGLFPGNRLPFIAFSVVAVGVILLMFRRLAERSAVHVASMGLLLGGAVGNLHDRIRFGEVTDFIQVGVAGHYWPVFNVADSAITVGVALLVLSLMRGEGEPASESDPEAASARAMAPTGQGPEPAASATRDGSSVGS